MPMDVVAEVEHVISPLAASYAKVAITLAPISSAAMASIRGTMAYGRRIATDVTGIKAAPKDVPPSIGEKVGRFLTYGEAIAGFRQATLERP